MYSLRRYTHEVLGLQQQMKKSLLLKKGQEVALDGRLVNSEYEGKNGEKRYVTKVELKEFLLLTPADDAK